MKSKDVCELAVETYGTTDNIKRIGFIMRDGKTLDLGPSSKTLEYRHITHVGASRKILDPEGKSDKNEWELLREFQNICGAVRIGVDNSKFLYVDMVKPPTAEQRDTLRDILIQHDGAVIERMSPEDKSLCTVETWSDSQHILNRFLRECFEDGR